MDRTYCEAWPEQLKEAEARRYRAACRIRLLESMLDRIGPEDFDGVMKQLEEAHREAQEAGAEADRLKWEFYNAGYTFT